MAALCPEFLIAIPFDWLDSNRHRVQRARGKMGFRHLGYRKSEALTVEKAAGNGYFLDIWFLRRRAMFGDGPQKRLTGFRWEGRVHKRAERRYRRRQRSAR
ncbi:MAG TPA: hypothetical protein VGJ20_00135 [Xanthobacteraceae bacterium]